MKNTRSKSASSSTTIVPTTTDSVLAATTLGIKNEPTDISVVVTSTGTTGSTTSVSASPSTTSSTSTSTSTITTNTTTNIKQQQRSPDEQMKKQQQQLQQQQNDDINDNNDDKKQQQQSSIEDIKAAARAYALSQTVSTKATATTTATVLQSNTFDSNKKQNQYSYQQVPISATTTTTTNTMTNTGISYSKQDAARAYALSGDNVSVSTSTSKGKRSRGNKQQQQSTQAAAIMLPTYPNIPSIPYNANQQIQLQQQTHYQPQHHLFAGTSHPQTPYMPIPLQHPPLPPSSSRSTASSRKKTKATTTTSAIGATSSTSSYMHQPQPILYPVLMPPPSSLPHHQQHSLQPYNNGNQHHYHQQQPQQHQQQQHHQHILYNQNVPTDLTSSKNSSKKGQNNRKKKSNVVKSSLSLHQSQTTTAIAPTKTSNQSKQQQSVVLDEDLDDYDRFVKLLGINFSDTDDAILNNLIIDDDDDEFQLEEDEEEDDDDEEEEDDKNDNDNEVVQNLDTTNNISNVNELDQEKLVDEGNSNNKSAINYDCGNDDDDEDEEEDDDDDDDDDDDLDNRYDWDAEFYQELADELGGLEQEDMDAAVDAAVESLLKDYPTGSNSTSTSNDQHHHHGGSSNSINDNDDTIPEGTLQSKTTVVIAHGGNTASILSTGNSNNIHDKCLTPKRGKGANDLTSTVATPASVMKKKQVTGEDLHLAQQQLLPALSSTTTTTTTTTTTAGIASQQQQQSTNPTMSFALSTSTVDKKTNTSAAATTTVGNDGGDICMGETPNKIKKDSTNVSYDHQTAAVTPEQQDQLHDLLQKHYQLLLQQAVVAVRAAHIQRTKKSLSSSSSSFNNVSTTAANALFPTTANDVLDTTDNVSTNNNASPDSIQDGNNRAIEYLSGGETADDLIEILDGAVTMLQDLDHNRKDSIRQYIQHFDTTVSSTIQTRGNKRRHTGLPIAINSSMADNNNNDVNIKLEECDDNEDENNNKNERKRRRSSNEGIHSLPVVVLGERRLTRAQFTKTLQEEEEKSSFDAETIFDIQGLSKLKSTFDLIDKSVDGIRFKNNNTNNNAYKYNTSSTSTVDNTNESCNENINYTGHGGNTNNILEMTTNYQACMHVLEFVGADADNNLVPGSRDLSENLVDVKEYFGDDFKPPCSPEQVLTLRRNRNLFTSGEDNLVLRGVNLYGEKQWHLIADRFLPDRTINNISQRYSKICYLLYKAHGIYIDDNGNLATPPKFESVDDLDDVAIGKLKKVDPPAIMNVHRWSPEEDLTLLKAVPLMGSMWAELKARLIPHRDRGHLRKRYQVLERRVKATVTRIVKNERLAIIKIVSPNKGSSKQNGSGKGKANRSKLTSTRLFADNTHSDSGCIGNEDPNGQVLVVLKNSSQPKSTQNNNLDLTKGTSPSDDNIHSNVLTTLPALSSKKSSSRKLQGKKNAQKADDDQTTSPEASALISEPSQTIVNHPADVNHHSIRHNLPSSPSHPYYQYPMPNPPPPPPHHGVTPYQHHNPFFAGYMQQLPPPGYPYHHPYLQKYPQHHNPYFNRNDLPPPWLSPSQNIDETSRAQFEKLASDGVHDWSRMGDIESAVEDEVTIAGTQLTSLAKSPSTKLRSDTETRTSNNSSRNDVANMAIASDDGKASAYFGPITKYGTDGNREKQAEPTSGSFLATVMNHSNSQSKNASKGSFSVATTNPFTESNIGTPSEVGISSTSSTPANIRMSLFADNFSNISTDLRMSQLAKYSPGSSLNSRLPIIGENVDTFHFGDKSIDSYAVHHTFPSSSRLTDAASSSYQGDLAQSNDDNHTSHTETPFNILELATDLIALRDSPAKSSQHQEMSVMPYVKTENDTSTQQDRTDESGKPQKSLFSKVIGKNGSDKGNDNDAKSSTVKKSNIRKRQKLF